MKVSVTGSMILRIPLALVFLVTAPLILIQPASAAVHALLVGVNSYPALGPDFTLRGPGNDVIAARNFLTSRNVPAERITLLADGVEGAIGDPTLGTIEKAIDAIRQQVGPGDTVYLHFAGHGSQQLGAALEDEGDSLDEVFLPMDAQPMDEEIGVFPNALSDGLLRRHVTRLRNTGAFVWLVFDSCHSGGMTRGAGGGSERRVRLALDPRELRSLRRRLAGTGSELLPAPPEIPVLKPDAGGFAAFFAAQDNQATLERRMVPEDERVFGVFSFNLFSVLSRSPALSYQEAANALVASYAAQGETSAVPKFEGTGLAKTVLGMEEVNTRPAWPIVRRNPPGSVSPVGTHVLTAGRLQGLGPGDEIAVTRVTRDTTEGLGLAAITEATMFESRLEAKSDKLRQLFAAADRAEGAVLWGEASKRRFRADFTVALPSEASSGPLRQAVNRLKRDTDLADAFGIRWVSPDAPADFRLLQRGDTTVLSAADGVIDGDGSGPSPATIALTGELEQDAARLRDAIRKAARARLVMTLALEAASVPFDDTIALRLQVAAVAPEALSRVAKRSDLNCGRVARLDNEDFVNGVTVLGHCDLLTLQIRNRSREDWDLTILFLGAENDLAVLFPPVGQSNRIHAGDRLPPLRFAAYTDDNTGPRNVAERLIILAQEAKPGHPEADFRFLADNQPGASSRGAGLTGYGAAIAAAAQSQGSRGIDLGTSGHDGPRGTATVLQWILQRGR
ncbi:caspase family protein [Hwanghaeella sp.]|uniref:caspase family protein n=1 Tax=Hwanghaeella sp. TaxID=2605943 RepID=UPI003CCC1B19